MNAEKCSPVVDDLGEDDVEIGEAAVGDPHLLAVQDEAAVRLADRARFRAERVGARARLAQAVRADDLAGQQPRQIPLLLILGAEQRERQHQQVRVGAERRAERRRLRHPLADDHRRRPCRARRRRTPRRRRRQAARARRSVSRGRAPAPSLSARVDRAPAGPRWSTKSVTVWAISRCSSVSRAGVKTSAGLGRLQQPLAAAQGRR